MFKRSNLTAGDPPRDPGMTVGKVMRVREGLDGIELTDALWAYVRRIRTGADDAELVIGSAKNLEEATVRPRA
jgi:hypothetical protein